MTGTSIDGMDAALVQMTGDGLDLQARLVRHISRPLGPLAERLRAAASQHPMSSSDFAALAWDFGLLHGQIIGELLDDQAAPDLIAVHGQTVFHEPPVSWQLINPAPIAAKFACAVVYDLRQADLAIGGQGAPITPAADWVLFRDRAKSRAIVNLGGFCNVTVLPADRDREAHSRVVGFDVCACNQVLDAIARLALGQPFDVDGKAARAGQVRFEVAEQLLALLRRQRAASRSLGTGDEAVAWVDQHAKVMTGNDLAASAVEAVARCVAAALAEHGADEIIIGGGGVKNAALLARLSEAAATPLRISDELGIPAEAREAVCIAVLGDRAFAEHRVCSVAYPAASH